MLVGRAIQLHGMAGTVIVPVALLLISVWIVLLAMVLLAVPKRLMRTRGVRIGVVFLGLVRLLLRLAAVWCCAGGTVVWCGTCRTVIWRSARRTIVGRNAPGTVVWRNTPGTIVRRGAPGAVVGSGARCAVGVVRVAAISAMMDGALIVLGERRGRGGEVRLAGIVLVVMHLRLVRKRADRVVVRVVAALGVARHGRIVLAREICLVVTVILRTGEGAGGRPASTHGRGIVNVIVNGEVGKGRLG